MTKEVMNWNNIVGGKKAERIPCPDGIEGCLVAHYKVIQEQPKSSGRYMTKEAIKQALKVFGGCNWHDEIVSGDWADKAQSAIKALEEALNQDQSEQLARLGWQEIDCPICGGGARAFPKQEQGEPVGSVMSWDGSLIHGWFGEPPPEGTLLYIKPQYRKPLTDERIADIVREVSHGSAIRRDGSTSMRIARAIESAHGIKE